MSLLLTQLVLLMSSATLPFSTILGEAEVLGGPTGGNFDSPFHAFDLRRPDGSSRLVGFNNNGDSYRVLDGPHLTDLLPGPASLGGLGVPVGLNRSAGPTAMDHCGCWLQAAASLPADKPGLVRGFYHEETDCDYARNGFTNKSIAYAESTDGGLSFTKTGWPHNQIIRPTGANTTATAARGQQVGEGDHSVVVVGGWLLLFFYEWDASPTGFGLARSAVTDGGVPGSWKKYLCSRTEGCGFTSDGLGGDSSVLSGITGPTVTWRPQPGANSSGGGAGTNSSGGAGGGGGEFIAVGTRGGGVWQDPVLVGCGPRLSFARPAEGEPPVRFEPAAEPLIFADSESWARSNASRELFAYDSIVVDPVDSSTLWYYYTYLQPGASFRERYFVRRRIDTDRTSAINASRVILTLRQGQARPDGREGDWWASTAAVPSSAAFAFVATVGTVLVTGGENRVKLIDCYISQWDDHMIAHESECTATSTSALTRVPTHPPLFSTLHAPCGVLDLVTMDVAC